MKHRDLAILILALFLVGSTALVTRTSASDKTPFTATETFDPFGQLGPPVGEILSQGVVS